MYTRQSRNSNQKFKSPKKLVGKNFHSKRVNREDDKQEQTKRIPVQKVFTFDDLKNQLKAWSENENIPGKFQAWFTQDCKPENADWRFIQKIVGGHETLVIDPPAKDMDAPDIVKRLDEQLHKEHLHLLRKAIRQIWLRSTGNGKFALIIQANCHGRNSAHGYKTFVDFVSRTCPEIVSCHQIQCTPDHPFNPSSKISMRVDCKTNFGSEYLPIADTGFCMHVLDWAPRIKEAWISLPMRIKEAIHPAKGDKFFDFYSSSSYIGASLASYFDKVESMDCRETAMQSSRYNANVLADQNLKFHRASLDASTLAKFFSKAENDGRWTFYFNLPDNETLPSGVEQAIAQSRPERILLQTSDLEIAAKEIRRFRSEDYVLRKSIPLYLEPGSGRFELLMLFVPDRAGLLSQNSALKNKSRNVQRPRERIVDPNRSNIANFTMDRPTFKQRKG